MADREVVKELRRVSANFLALLLAIPAALWIARRERLILREGRGLTSEEHAFAKYLGIAALDAVRVQLVPRIPSPLWGLFSPLERCLELSLSDAAGVTLGYGIYVNEGCDSFSLVCHELVHVQQYERMGGPLPFIRQYFFECLAFGYSNSPLEREAVELSRQR